MLLSNKTLLKSPWPMLLSNKTLLKSPRPMLLSNKTLLKSPRPMLLSNKTLLKSPRPMLLSNKTLLKSPRPMLLSNMTPLKSSGTVHRLSVHGDRAELVLTLLGIQVDDVSLVRRLLLLTSLQVVANATPPRTTREGETSTASIPKPILPIGTTQAAAKGAGRAPVVTVAPRIPCPWELAGTHPSPSPSRQIGLSLVRLPVVELWVVDVVAWVAAEAGLGWALGAVVHGLLGVLPCRARGVAGATEAHLAPLAGVLLLLRGWHALQHMALSQAGHVLRFGVRGEVLRFEPWLHGGDGEGGADGGRVRHAGDRQCGGVGRCCGGGGGRGGRWRRRRESGVIAHCRRRRHWRACSLCGVWNRGVENVHQQGMVKIFSCTNGVLTSFLLCMFFLPFFFVLSLLSVSVSLSHTYTHIHTNARTHYGHSWLNWVRLASLAVEHTQTVDFTPKYGHSWVHWVDHTQHYRHSWLSDTDFPGRRTTPKLLTSHQHTDAAGFSGDTCSPALPSVSLASGQFVIQGQHPSCWPHSTTDTAGFSEWRLLHGTPSVGLSSGQFVIQGQHQAVNLTPTYRHSRLKWATLASRYFPRWASQVDSCNTGCWPHTNIQTQQASVGDAGFPVLPSVSIASGQFVIQVVDLTPTYRRSSFSGRRWLPVLPSVSIASGQFVIQVVDLTPTYRRSRLQWATLASRYFPRWASQVDSL